MRTLMADQPPGRTAICFPCMGVHDKPSRRMRPVRIRLGAVWFWPTLASLIAGFQFQSATLCAQLSESFADPAGTLDVRFQQPEFGWWANGSWITATALQPDGKIVVGGHFTLLNGERTLGIARLLPDGTRDSSFSFDSGELFFGMPVTAVALQPDGKILFVCRPATYGQFLARLESTGKTDPTFAATVGGSINAVQVLPSGNIVIGGRFRYVNDVVRHSIARLLADGTVDETFQPGTGVRNQGEPGVVNAIALQSDGKWLIGGQFTSVDGLRRTNVARLYANGAVDPSFDAGAVLGQDNEFYVAALAVRPNGKVLVGGHFDPSPFATSRNLVRLHASGSLDVAFNRNGRGTDATEGAEISKIQVQRDGRILVAGYFRKFNRTARNSLARLQRSGALDTSFDPTGWEAPIEIFDLLIQPDDQILVAGDFNYFDLAPTGIARVNPGIMDFKFYAVRRSSSGTFFRFEIPPGTVYKLQRSVDLLDWKPVVTLSNQTHWTDSSSGTHSKQFYRAIRTVP